MTLIHWFYWYMFVSGIIAGYITALMYRDEEPSFLLILKKLACLIFISFFGVPIALIIGSYFTYHLFRDFKGFSASAEKTEPSNP